MSGEALVSKSPTSWICPRCRASYASGDERCAADGWKLVHNLAGLEINKRYRLERLIGVGGMDGTVWRSIQFPTEREVAVKLLPLSDAAALQRFERGARLASKLNHPNITTIHDYGQTDDGRLYLAMELLEGRTLADHIKRSSLDIRETLHISLQLLKAVEHAHAKQIVHRDIKPANIFLVSKNEDSFFVKILDFGIARSVSDLTVEESFGPGPEESITQAHQICGTPEYMAPEQITGGPPEPRTDIYALGVTMYRLLSGKLPFQSKDRHDLYHRHLNEAPPPFSADLNIPETISRVVMKALAKSPGERYADAAEMRQALTEAGRKAAGEIGVSFSGIFSTDGALVRPTGTGPSSPPHAEDSGSSGRRRAWIAVAAILLLGVGAVLIAQLAGGGAAEIVSEPASRQPASQAASLEAPPAVPAIEPVAESASPQPDEPAATAAVIPAPTAAEPSPGAVEPERAVAQPDEATPVPADEPVAPVDALPIVGILKMAGGPDGAEVWEGDRLLGVLPLETELPVGPHALKVRAPGHKPADLSVDTQAGSTAQAVVHLERYGVRAAYPRPATRPDPAQGAGSPTQAGAPPAGVATAASAGVSSSPSISTESANADPKDAPTARPRLLGAQPRPRLLGEETAAPVRVLGQ